MSKPDLDLTALRQACEQAEPIVIAAKRHQQVILLPDDEQRWRAFTALANPTTILALLTDLRQAQALRKLAEEFLESPPDDADGYWENFSKRLCAALSGATED